MPCLVEISKVALKKKNFLISFMYFRYFVIISPWKRAGPFICINLNLLHQSGSGEEEENVKQQRRRWTMDKL